MSPVSVETVRVRSQFHIIIWGSFNWPGVLQPQRDDATSSTSPAPRSLWRHLGRILVSGLRCQICRKGQERSQARRNAASSRWKPDSFEMVSAFVYFLRYFSVEPVEMTAAVFAVEAELKIGVNVAGRWLFVPSPFATLRVWTVGFLLVNVGTLFHRKMDGNGTELCSRWDALQTTRIKTLGSTVTLINKPNL